MWWLATIAAADDVAPPRPDGPVSAVSPFHLVVRFGETEAFSRDAAAWSLDCGADRSQAMSLSVKTFPIDLVAEGWPYRAVVAHDVILKFDTPIPTGACELSDGTASFAVDHDPELGRTPALRLNQVGFTPGTAHAAVSYWSPAERIDLSSARAFHVVDGETGETALSGELTLRPVTADDAYGNDYTLADVWDLDLSALTDGWYYVVWDGVGRSWSFRVGADVWDDPFYIAFRGLLHQRCGGALDPALTPWSHGECHVAPVELTSADYQIVGEDAFTALPDAAIGVQREAHGGYHDAADYDRNWGHLRIIDELVDLWALDPVAHGRDDLGLPESGNGVADLLDEAAWGLSTWSRLQQDDGGVPGCVGTTAYPELDEMPDVDDGVFYACAADPLASYRFAGAAAKLGGALGDAAMVDAAEAAWAWAEANPQPYDTNYHAVYAAAALLAATGDSAWDTLFRERGPLADPGFALYDWDGDEWHEALYTYARAAAADPPTRDHAIAVLDGRAAAWLAWAQGSAWRLVKHPYAPITNGTGTTPTGSGLLLRVHALTGNETYREWASYGADNSLGANASGWSWTTGLGDQPVLDPLQTPSLGDGIAAPVPGITVYGPNYLTEGTNNVAVALAAFEPPIDQWPLLERYADVGYVPNMNEFTVAENVGPTLFAFGALASWSAAPEEPGATDGGGEDTDPPVGEDTDDDSAVATADEKVGCGCNQPRAGGVTGLVLAGLVLRRRRAR